MDNETLLLLLQGKHFNMEERIKMKLWPHPPLRFSDLIGIISQYLKVHLYFPRQWIEKKDGELIDDTSSIERKENGIFVYRSRSAHPTNLKKIGERTELAFKTAEEAADYFLRHDLRLPGDLDGWEVVDDVPNGEVR